MIELIRELLTEDFLKFICGLSIILLANTITGIMKAVKAGKFDWKTLLTGVCSYIAWGVSAAFSVIGFQIYGGDFTVIINGNAITLLAAIEVAKKAVYMYWSAKCIANFIEFANVDTSIIQPDQPDEIKDLYETQAETTSDEEEKG